jgi:hypothetical protein
VTDRAVRAFGLALAIAGAVGGFIVAFAAWGVGYCGGLTPDTAPAGTLRSDLCRGTSGDLFGGVVFASWLLAAAAPLLGMYWARRIEAVWPLVLCTAVGAAPIATIAILAHALPQN